jgi:hypothetical protein
MTVSMGRDAVQSGVSVPTFRRDVLPLSPGRLGEQNTHTHTHRAEVNMIADDKL